MIGALALVLASIAASASALEPGLYYMQPAVNRGIFVRHCNFDLYACASPGSNQDFTWNVVSSEEVPRKLI